MRGRRGTYPENKITRKQGFDPGSCGRGRELLLYPTNLVEGVDIEIALLRAKIRSIADQEPHNDVLITEATAILSGLIRTRNKLARMEREKRLEKAIYKSLAEDILANIIVPMISNPQKDN
jgi:hypothetical protein